MTLRESYTEPLLDWIKREALSRMFSGWPRYDTHTQAYGICAHDAATDAERAGPL